MDNRKSKTTSKKSNKKQRQRKIPKGGNQHQHQHQQWMDDFTTRVVDDTQQFVNDFQNNSESLVNTFLNIFNGDDRDKKKEVCKELNLETCPNYLVQEEAEQLVSNISETQPPPIPPRTSIPQTHAMTSVESTAPMPPPRRTRREKQNNLTRLNELEEIDDTSNVPNQTEDMDMYSKFNTIYNSLIDTMYDKYKSRNSGNIRDNNLKTILMTMSLIPTITQDLETLTQHERDTLEESYKLLLTVVKNNCDSSSWKRFQCNTLSHTVGENDFYKVLKGDSKLYSDTAIPSETLLKFIKLITPKVLETFAKIKDEQVLPIIIELKEFAKYYSIDIKLGGKYSKLAKQKNTSTNNIVKKFILGKERNVYKVSGSKKDHIKYKNNFITVSEYKIMMKQ